MSFFQAAANNNSFVVMYNITHRESFPECAIVAYLKERNTMISFQNARFAREAMITCERW
jgi:hypothetical protein